MTSQVLFYLFGALASAGFISSNYTVNKNLVLLLQSLGSIAVSIQFAIINIYAVAAVNSIFLIRNAIVYYLERREEKARPKKYLINIARIAMLALLLIYFLTTPIPSDYSAVALALFFLPLLAGIFNILAIAQKSLISLKWLIFLSVSSWAIFDILTSAWTTLIGDSFSMIACLVAIVRLKKMGKPRTI